MDEIINVSVNGNTLTKDYNCAGTQGECNSTVLRITFDKNWDGCEKKITFWDALGQNPVRILLGNNLIENILDEENRTYLVPIPGEAMTESGENTFVIEGSIINEKVTEKVKRSVEGKLKVLASRKADNAANPTTPTSDAISQIRSELDAFRENINAAVWGAYETGLNVEAAQKAQSLAENAAAAAKHSANSVENMEVTYTRISENEASVESSYDPSNNRVNLHFELPLRESGVHIGNNPPTDPNKNVWIDTNGGDNFTAFQKYVRERFEQVYIDMAHSHDSCVAQWEYDAHITAFEKHVANFTTFKVSGVDQLISNALSYHKNAENAHGIDDKLATLKSEVIAEIKDTVVADFENAILGGEW